MPRIGLTFAALFVAAFALAQGPAAPGQPLQVPGPPASRVPVPGGGAPAVQPTLPVDPKIKAHLDAWESRMKESTNFYSECRVVRKNLLHKTEKNLKGQVACLKPNMAYMRIDEVPPPNVLKNPNAYEAYICNGKAVYEYDASAKTVNEYPLPANGVSGNLLLDFLSGAMTAKAALERFEIKEAKPDPNYVFLELRPKLAEDKVDFEVMTVVLFGPNVPKDYVPYLPCVVVIRKANGQHEETWHFDLPKVNVAGLGANFFAVQFPPGWKHVKQQPKPAVGAKPTGVPTTNIPPLGPPKQ